MTTDLVDRHTAARMLNVSTRQLLRYVDNGWLTQYRSSSGRVAYSKQELRKIAQRKARAAAQETYYPTARRGL